MIKQLDENDCGHAVTRYVLARKGNCDSYAYYPLKRKCDNLLQIKDELYDKGLVYEGYECLDKSLASFPKDTIIRIEGENDFHFNLFLGKKGRKYRFYDPTLGIYHKKGKELKDIKVSGCLIYKKGEVQKITKISPLPNITYVILSIIAILECLSCCLAFLFAKESLALFAIVSIASFASLLIIHLLYLLRVERKLDESFILKYFAYHPDRKDYKLIMKLKAKIIANPSTVFASITAFGILVFVLLTIGLPYLIASVGITVLKLAIDSTIRNYERDKLKKISSYEFNFTKSLKIRKNDLVSYRGAQKEGRAILKTKILSVIILITLSLLASLSIGLISKNTTLESFIQNVAFLLFVSEVVSGLWRRLGNLDFSYQELSKLNRYAYELLCNKAT